MFHMALKVKRKLATEPPTFCVFLLHNVMCAIFGFSVRLIFLMMPLRLRMEDVGNYRYD
jgi:hypothetical protein